jgi:hypothetical protein
MAFNGGTAMFFNRDRLEEMEERSNENARVWSKFFGSIRRKVGNEPETEVLGDMIARERGIAAWCKRHLSP